MQGVLQCLKQSAVLLKETLNPHPLFSSFPASLSSAASSSCSLSAWQHSHLSPSVQTTLPYSASCVLEKTLTVLNHAPCSSAATAFLFLQNLPSTLDVSDSRRLGDQTSGAAEEQRPHLSLSSACGIHTGDTPAQGEGWSAQGSPQKGGISSTPTGNSTSQGQ